MKIGAEFEIAGLQQSNYPTKFWIGDVQFQVSSDRSIRPFGTEFKTLINVPENLVHPVFKDIGKFYSAMKASGGYCSASCGLHIHLDKPADFDFEIFKKKFQISKEHTPKKERQIFCMRQELGEKYSPVRLHPQGTIEFRFFNGCLNLRYLIRSIKTALNILAEGLPCGVG